VIECTKNFELLLLGYKFAGLAIRLLLQRRGRKTEKETEGQREKEKGEEKEKESSISIKIERGEWLKFCSAANEWLSG
jgi:hypothetical protein